MSNFWKVMTTLNTGSTAVNTSEMAKEMKKQNELLRRSMLTPEERKAEDELKLRREREEQEKRSNTWWGILGVFLVLTYVALWYSEPLLAALVTIVIIIVLRKRKEKEQNGSGKDESKEGKNISEKTEKKSKGD